VTSRFNPPPGWPTPPEGWQPAPDWQPDPSWPAAPADWQFWLDDGFPAFLGQSAPVRTSSTGRGFRWLGWAGLAVVALLGLLTGGVSSGLVMAGLYVLVVGVVALARGQVGWARLGSRMAGGLATGAGLVVLVVGALTAPASAPSAPGTVTVAAASTTTAPEPAVEPSPADTAAAEPADPTPTQVPPTTAVAATTRAAVAPKPVARPKAPAPKKTIAPAPKPKPKPKPKPTAASCTPLTNGGNCYEPGEFCRDSDHGASGVAGDGEKIVCRNNDGWRWEPA
jgi:hypothetical protein